MQVTSATSAGPLTRNVRGNRNSNDRPAARVVA
ncbi:hypothetical protein BDSB_21935 [Burkholderia dolosa PC543]|nr:hypothetical protein BDSB_21935 [Burkholderia dolosa PC543]